MEDDFKFSRDYLSLFNDAEKIKSWEKAKEVITGIYNELGQPNPYIGMATAEQGKRLAEMMNAKYSPDPAARGGKKV
jgi:hypothetical protein